jgi:hypothetical protein
LGQQLRNGCEDRELCDPVGVDKWNGWPAHVVSRILLLLDNLAGDE